MWGQEAVSEGTGNASETVKGKNRETAEGRRHHGMLKKT